ncbi:Ribonuclease MRP protein subunit rmp1 [Elasticomyces elasticus]|nr:Ribonuclease MRP protein subunit rmp1 [Elasticomyces elasticus]KAK3624188.1 Ribonuclease MRP protein subunit rmp1 [Elasticomyces elasticus]KAK4906394.1 Ribonuclease MRP protein subunit rmp1 [Elasticomyces elasticus]KAK5744659.1 Ribonuclease MRP protein subunit rmp1 [Elasticomyces elasticus]
MEVTPPEVSKEDLERLRHLPDLLHLFYHRNHKQHRRSTWWRAFSIFRKQLRTLLGHLDSLQQNPSTHIERMKKKIRDQQTRLKLEQFLVFWRDVLVPKWQHAFSQVAADGRFSNLDVCRIAGVTAAFDDLGQIEVEKVLERFAEEGWDGRGEVMARSVGAGGEDVGEVITRGASGSAPVAVAIIDEHDPVAAEKPQRPAEPTAKASTMKRSRNHGGTEPKAKKKRKKGDAIDDLFGGL